MSSTWYKKISDAIVQVGVYDLTAVLMGKILCDDFSLVIVSLCLMFGVCLILIGAFVAVYAAKVEEKEKTEQKKTSKGKRKYKLLRDSIYTVEEL